MVGVGVGLDVGVQVARRFVRFLRSSYVEVLWRKSNPHNLTVWRSGRFMDKVSVGNFTYGDIHARFFGDPLERISIGHLCSIAENVVILAGGGHPDDRLTTYPVSKLGLGSPRSQAVTRGEVRIGDDVWIGYGATILSGVAIGQGAVIGAGALVAKDVPPYAVFFGGEVRRYRFPPNVVERLLTIDYSRVSQALLVELQLWSREPLNDGFFDSSLFAQLSAVE